MNKIIKIILIYLAVLAPIASASNLDDFVEKIFSFKRIGQVISSPDGKLTAFIVKEQNKKTKEWNYLLYLKNSRNDCELIDKNSRPVSSPKWSADGAKLAYIASGEKFDSIWVYTIDMHRAYKIIEYVNDIAAFEWAPNGKYFAFISNDKNTNSSSMLINVEHNYKNNRLFIASVNGDLGHVEAITPKNMSISPGFLLSGFDWSPDSKNIVFNYQNKPGMEDPYQGKIGFVNLDTHKITNLPYSSSHTVGQVSYSPNSEWIAFESGVASLTVKKELRNNPYINNQICVANTQTFKTFCLGKTFNENSLLLGWNQSSDGVFVVETYKTIGPRIYILGLDSGAPKLISDINGFIDLPTLTLNNNHSFFGFRYETFTDAPEAYISRTDPFKMEKISHIQNPDKIISGKSQLINWRSKDNTEIEGILITPSNYNPKHRYPLYVDIHGGPADTWANRFVNGCDEHGSLFVPTSCTANLLNLGFVIFQPNIRGSDGYGKTFRIANVGDLGGKDYEDIIAGVDYLIHQNVADADRLVVAGWSYGGFMTAWAITQSNRFKLAIDGGGKTDMISFAGTTDMQWIQPQYMGASYWEDGSLYLNRSAIFYVKNIKTPLLILHGQNDKRVPIGQAYEFYSALKAHNQPVKMLVLPDTGHAPTAPSVIVESIKEVNLWLGKII
jgi:dipeptidyl aminopeptidase/acylaminoacyl peptidase